MSKGFKML